MRIYLAWAADSREQRARLIRAAEREDALIGKTPTADPHKGTTDVPYDQICGLLDLPGIRSVSVATTR